LAKDKGGGRRGMKAAHNAVRWRNGITFQGAWKAKGPTRQSGEQGLWKDEGGRG